MLKLIKQARTALSHLNPDEVRSRANQPFRIGLVASSNAGYSAMEDFLAPRAMPGGERAESLSCVHRAGDPGAPQKVDIALYEHGLPAPRDVYVFYPATPDFTVEAILRDKDDLALPLARRFPVFRKHAIERAIHSIARENAMFAVATALPDVIPSLIEIPWAFGEWASDTAFLTANQVRMAFLIAAACGREVGFSRQKLEILSIGGSAFGWRAIARELAGKIPLGGGLIPKGAIAYAGTYAVGKGLEALYGGNINLAPDARKGIYRQAFERGKALVQAFAPAKSASSPRQRIAPVARHTNP